MRRKPVIGSLAVLAICVGAYAFFELWTPGNQQAPENRAGTTADHPRIEPMTGLNDDPAALEAALAKNPSHTPILLRMGQLAIERGEPEAAVTHLREAVRSDPDSLDAQLELGRALYLSGETDEAIGETEALLLRDPQHVDALYNLGAIHANQGAVALAKDYWRRAVAAGPSAPSGQNARRGLQALVAGSVPVQVIPGSEAAARGQTPPPGQQAAVEGEVQQMILQLSGRK